MTATLETSLARTGPELAITELAGEDIELLPDRETLCGWHCYYPCHPCCCWYVPTWCCG